MFLETFFFLHRYVSWLMSEIDGEKINTSFLAFDAMKNSVVCT